ncbi:MAG TPA: hypothetical protein VIL74_07550 [Pyrinomonadaceae bacterium]
MNLGVYKVPVSGSCSSAPKPQPTPKQAIRNPAKAYNILSVLNYPEYWTDRQITITGSIKLASLPIRDGSGRRVSQAFRLLDDSGSIIVYAPESDGTANLRDAIIRNDGDPLEGKFTFFVPKELDQSIGETNETIGKLVKYMLF